MILTLPPHTKPSGNSPGVTSLLCSGFGLVPKYLVCGDEVGYITVWRIPIETQSGLEYTPLKTFQAHSVAINAMVTTSRYLITGCAEGIVNIMSWKEQASSLPLLALIRSINLIEWCKPEELFIQKHIRRRIQSMHLNMASEEREDGWLFIGTSYGEIVILNCGICM